MFNISAIIPDIELVDPNWPLPSRQEAGGGLKRRMRAHTLQIKMAASLAWDLPIALNLAAFALITT